MISGQAKGFQQINILQAKLSNAWVHYWQHYSSLNTWQFWCLAVLLVLPLLVLYLRIDRTKALQIAFFGLNIHVWTSKLDEIAIYIGLWNYPHTMVPYLTSSLVMDASLEPVMFMLVYQWTQNHKRNFYLYAVGLSIALAFVVRPAFATFAFFSVKRPVNYFVLCLIYIVVGIVSKWITNVFVHFQIEGNSFSPRAIRQDTFEQPIIRPEKEKSFFRRRKRTIKRIRV